MDKKVKDIELTEEAIKALVEDNEGNLKKVELSLSTEEEINKMFN